MKLVCVDWVDSYSGEGWRPIEQIQSESELFPCRTIGWVVSDNKHALTLINTVGGHMNENVVPIGCGDITIPKVAITRLRTIKEKP